MVTGGAGGAVGDSVPNELTRALVVDVLRNAFDLTFRNRLEAVALAEHTPGNTGREFTEQTGSVVAKKSTKEASSTANASLGLAGHGNGRDDGGGVELHVDRCGW